MTREECIAFCKEHRGYQIASLKTTPRYGGLVDAPANDVKTWERCRDTLTAIIGYLEQKP